MPSVTIVKVKVRRGTDDQRKAITLEQGELGFTVDTKRLYIGDGTTLGGLAVAPQIYTPLSKTYSITGVTASVGEIVPAGSLIYQLTSSDYSALSSWAIISTKPDNVTLEYTGTDSKVLSIKSNAVGSNSFNSTAAYEFGGIIATASNGLSANVDGTYAILSSNQITIASISADKISSNAVGAGLLGGNGNKIVVNTGPGFAFDSTTKFLKLTSLPSKIATLDSIDTTTIYGDGLSLDNDDKLILDKNNILGYGLDLDGSNKIRVNGNSLVIPGSGILYSSNNQGLYLDLPSVIGDNLSLNSTTGKLQANVPISDNVTINTLSGNILTIADTLNDNLNSPVSLPTISYNTKGQITNIYSSIINVLTASNTGSISAFNGAPNQISLQYSRSNQTLINTVSATLDDDQNVIGTRVLQLTSAGFIALNATSTDSDVIVDRFAIPVFTY